MEEDTILVLFDLRGYFEEGEDQRGGLCGGEWRVRERVGAEGMVEDIGGAREQESHGIGQEGGGRGAVTVEVILHGLDVVFAIPPGAVEFFIDPLGCRRLKRGDDEAWIVASGH